MKRLFILLPIVAVALFSSCMGDEPLNAECDIERITVQVDDPMTLFYHDYDVTQIVPSAVNSITYQLRAGAVVTQLPVVLTVTEGAQIFLQETDGYQPFTSGSMVDFSGGKQRQFMVKSQDGKWERYYTVAFESLYAELGARTLTIDFEDYALNDPSKTEDNSGVYYVWTENDSNAISTDQWVCGNPGFKLSKSSAKPNDYPTVPLANEGIDGGACLKLETRDTGAFGRMVNMRIAAGNFFIGTFDVDNALKDALAATRFGLPFAHKPVKMSGWYKFKAGERFQDKKGNAVDRTDMPDAYCILYRNEDPEGKRVLLDGADVLTNPNIVGLGRISGVVETNEWTRFEIPVEYTEDVDDELLMNFGYSMTICFSSSIEGAYFEGAPGSTFLVDKVTVDCAY